MQEKGSQNVISILERLKSAKRFTTNIQLSEYLGVKPNTISNWKARETLDYNLIITKCVEDGMDMNWLIKGEAGIVQADSQSKLVPIYSQYALANSFIDGNAQDNEYVSGHLELPEFRNAAGAIVVEGDSMYPHFKPGDYAVVQKVYASYDLPWNKPAVICTYSGSVFIKYLYKDPDDKKRFVLVSANPQHDPLIIPQDDVRDMFRVIARVERLGG